jgi:hypothetical protein
MRGKRPRRGVSLQLRQTRAYLRPQESHDTPPPPAAPPHPHPAMADPFEVRQRFTTLLSHLSASHTSLQKAAFYALKNRDMDEDLHSCILEQLERTNMNTRANIMFFIECLCELAVKENGNGGDGSAMGFVRMLQRDILRVVECVIGDEGANVRVVRRVSENESGSWLLSILTPPGTARPAVQVNPPARDSQRAGSSPQVARGRAPLHR